MIEKLTDTVYTEADFVTGDHDQDITTTLNFKVTNNDGTNKSVTYGNFHSGITDLAITVLKEQLNELSRGEVSSAFKIEKRSIRGEIESQQVQRVRRKI